MQDTQHQYEFRMINKGVNLKNTVSKPETIQSQIIFKTEKDHVEYLKKKLKQLAL